MLKKILIVIGVILIGIQFIPVNRSNPTVTQEIDAPANVLSILKTSCYDCHSNETEWPWYSKVAPVSFLVAADVRNGRKRVNFSEWDKYDEKKKEKKLEHIIEMVEEGEMPLPNYLIMHSNAKLDSSKIKALKDWVTGNDSSEGKLRYEQNHNDD
jgi:hypothetical protein